MSSVGIIKIEYIIDHQVEVHLKNGHSQDIKNPSMKNAKKTSKKEIERKKLKNQSEQIDENEVLEIISSYEVECPGV